MRKLGMKHQLTLRRLLLYVALFAIGFALLHFALSSRIEPPVLQVAAFCLSMNCVSVAACCPIGYLIAGKAGEIGAIVAALFVGLAGTPLSLVLMGTEVFGW